MPAKKYITRLMPAEGVVVGTQSVQNKVRGDLKKELDSKDADKIIEKNRANPNTVLDEEEKRALVEGTVGEEEEEEKRKNQEAANKSTLKPEDIARPATSQADHRSKK